MRIKNTGLACGIAVCTLLSGCKKENSQPIFKKIAKQTLIETKSYIRNDSIFNFYNKPVTSTSTKCGITCIDTISGFLKTEKDDMITFIFKSKQPPKGVKQIGRITKDGSVNYIY